MNFVPVGKAYTEERKESRKKLMLVVEKLTGKPVHEEAFLVATSGRYEYRNKGIDVFIDTMDKLRKSNGINREINAVIMTPAR